VQVVLHSIVERRRLDPQRLVQLGAGGRVLQVDGLAREHVRRRAECSQRGFVEAAQDQLLLAGIGVDVAHREDARDAGLELLGVDDDLLALQRQAPVGDRAELGTEAEEHQQHVQRHDARDAVAAGDLHAAEAAVGFLVAGDLADEELHLHRLAQLAHARHGGRRGAEAVAAVDEDHARSLVRAILREVVRPVERGIAAADDDEVLAGKLRRVLDAVEELPLLVPLDPVELEAPRLERAHAGGDEHRAGEEARAAGGLDAEPAVGLLLDHGHFLAEVEGRMERLDLLEQVVGQLAAGAHRHGRNVVDRLVGIELDALAAGIGQGVDDVRLDLQQPELEHLEQPDGAGPDDERVGVDDLRLRLLRRGDGHGGRQRISSSSLPVRLRHSSASGSGSLRLVMLGHFLASSAFSAMKCCWSAGTSSSGRMALTGHSGMHTAQSMHSSGSMARKLGPSRKQSTGQTSTQSVYLQRMQASVTTWVMVGLVGFDGCLRCAATRRTSGGELGRRARAPNA
jgi:hypothetical protein